MTNAIERANVRIAPANRRAILRAIFAVGAAASLPAVAGASETDPIFAAIEKHQAAWRRFNDVCDLCDDVAAKLEGRKITMEDRRVKRSADKAELAALAELLETPPQTKAGAQAVITWLLRYDCGDTETVGRYAPTLLRSPLFA